MSATNGVGSLCMACRSGKGQTVQKLILQGAQMREQKEEQQIRQRKGIRVAFKDGAGLLCGTPAKKIALPCLYSS